MAYKRPDPISVVEEHETKDDAQRHETRERERREERAEKQHQLDVARLDRDLKEELKKQQPSESTKKQPRSEAEKVRADWQKQQGRTLEVMKLREQESKKIYEHFRHDTEKRDALLEQLDTWAEQQIGLDEGALERYKPRRTPRLSSKEQVKRFIDDWPDLTLPTARGVCPPRQDGRSLPCAFSGYRTATV